MRGECKYPRSLLLVLKRNRKKSTGNINSESTDSDSRSITSGANKKSRCSTKNNKNHRRKRYKVCPGVNPTTRIYGRSSHTMSIQKKTAHVFQVVTKLKSCHFAKKPYNCLHAFGIEMNLVNTSVKLSECDLHFR